MGYWNWFDEDFPGPPRHWAISGNRVFQAVWWTIAIVVAVTVAGAAFAWWLFLLFYG